MPFPRVWSERNEPSGGAWKDCTYSAGLMALVYGDKIDYPKGIYTVTEREALERSDNQPDETGASIDDLILAIKNRYNITTLTKNAPAALSDLLDKESRAVVVQGKLSNFAAGHTLRRWQPGFTGGHAICVVCMPGNRYVWLDPLAPMKFEGDIVGKGQILKFAIGLGYSMGVRYGQFRPVITSGITQAQYDAVVAARDAATAALDAANAKIAAAKAALG